MAEEARSACKRFLVNAIVPTLCLPCVASGCAFESLLESLDIIPSTNVKDFKINRPSGIASNFLCIDESDVLGARRSEFQNNPSILFQAFETCRFQRQTHGGWIKRTLLHDRDVLLGGDHLKTKVSIIVTNWSNFFKRGSNSMEQ